MKDSMAEPADYEIAKMVMRREINVLFERAGTATQAGEKDK